MVGWGYVTRKLNISNAKPVYPRLLAGRPIPRATRPAVSLQLDLQSLRVDHS